MVVCSKILKRDITTQVLLGLKGDDILVSTDEVVRLEPFSKTVSVFLT